MRQSSAIIGARTRVQVLLLLTHACAPNCCYYRRTSARPSIQISLHDRAPMFCNYRCTPSDINARARAKVLLLSAHHARAPNCSYHQRTSARISSLFIGARARAKVLLLLAHARTIKCCYYWRTRARPIAAIISAQAHTHVLLISAHERAPKFCYYRHTHARSSAAIIGARGRAQLLLLLAHERTPKFF